MEIIIMTQTNVEEATVQTKVEPTDAATEVENLEAQEKQEETTMTQEQFENILEQRLARQRRALLKKYEGVDVEKYNNLVEAEESRKKEELLSRQQFDEVLKNTVEKKDTVISKLQSELHNIKVEGALLQSASNRRAIKPDQMVKLLRDQVRLSEDGAVEIVDAGTKAVRYTDQGEHMTIDNLVEEFLSTNPHYMTANSAGSGSESRGQPTGNGKIDITKLNMRNPEDRKIYAEYRKAQGITT